MKKSIILSILLFCSALYANTLYQFSVVRVVDGDTLEVAFLNDYEGIAYKARLLGIDTPESRRGARARSQTEAFDGSDFQIPELHKADTDEETIETVWNKLEKMLKEAGVKFSIEQTTDYNIGVGVGGFYQRDKADASNKRIVVSNHLSRKSQISVLIHEISHWIWDMHETSKNDEIHADLTSFLIQLMLGLNPKNNQAYIENHFRKPIDELEEDVILECFEQAQSFVKKCK